VENKYNIYDKILAKMIEEIKNQSDSSDNIYISYDKVPGFNILIKMAEIVAALDDKVVIIYTRDIISLILLKFKYRKNRKITVRQKKSDNYIRSYKILFNIYYDDMVSNGITYGEIWDEYYQNTK
jgi:hypothetical protein